MTLPNFAKSSSQGPEDEQLNTADFEGSVMLVLYLLNKGTSMHCTGVMSVRVVAGSLHHSALRHKARLAHLGSLQQNSSKRSHQSCTKSA